MNHDRTFAAVCGIAFIAIVLAPSRGSSSQLPTSLLQGKGHPFACADYSQGKVFFVSAEGKVDWDYQAPNCDDLWVLPNGNLLFNARKAVKEVTRDRKVVFNYESTSKIYACQRLASGNTFIAECDAGRLLEVNPAGKIVKELRLLPEGATGGHDYIRNARVLPNGHYLVAHYGKQMVKEYDPQGNVVMEIPARGGPHSVIRLPQGNTLISCGDKDEEGARVLEVDKTGKKIWEITRDELPGIRLSFIAGLQRLPNGNTVMCNWLGHGQFGKGPHLIEVTPDKRIVWTYGDQQAMRTVSAVQLLDVPGDVTRGEITR